MTGAASAWQPDGVVCFPGRCEPAERLAHALGVRCSEIAVHTFPDGETLVRADRSFRRPVVYQSLDRPNEKIMPVLLAASALRDLGADTVTLIAPYLAYMRQDRAFHPGEAVSQRVLGGVLAAHFDALVTVDPHLHRTPHLSDMFQGKPALALSAAPALVQHLHRIDPPRTTLIVGPDEESGSLVRQIAQELALESVTARKVRRSDRQVELTMPQHIDVGGRPVIVVDDVVSSGTTLIAVAGALRERGAGPIDIYVTHALCDAAVAGRLKGLGVRTFISTDTVSHPTNSIHIAAIIAGGLAAATRCA